MKVRKIFFAAIMLLCSALFYSCDSGAHKVFWSGDNLYIEIPRPGVGLEGVNVVTWNGVVFSDIMNDVHKAIKRKDKQYGSCRVYVRLVAGSTDKYGSANPRKDDYFVVEIPYNEAKKYQSGYYLDQAYGITDKIKDIALNKGVRHINF